MDAGPEDRNSKRESQPETWVRLPWGQGFNSLANKVASARRCLDEADATRTVLCLAEWNVSLLLVNRRSSVDGERMLEDAVCAGMKIIEERKKGTESEMGCLLLLLLLLSQRWMECHPRPLAGRESITASEPKRSEREMEFGER